MLLFCWVLFGWRGVDVFVYSVHNRGAVLELFAKLNQVFENAHKHSSLLCMQ